MREANSKLNQSVNEADIYQLVKVPNLKDRRMQKKKEHDEQKVHERAKSTSTNESRPFGDQ